MCAPACTPSAFTLRAVAQSRCPTPPAPWTYPAQEWERDGPSSGARVMLLTMRPGSKISAGALAALAPAPVTSDNLGIRMVCPRCVFRYDDQPHFYQWNKLSINNVTFRPYY